MDFSSLKTELADRGFSDLSDTRRGTCTCDNRVIKMAGRMAPKVLRTFAEDLHATRGLCQCGCGEKAPLATDSAAGREQGKPCRFIRGHNSRVKNPNPPVPVVDYDPARHGGRLCECGCGEPAAIARWTDRRRGLVMGWPGRFAHPSHARRKVGPRYVVNEETGCWEWQGATSRGYGMTWRDGEHVYTHRLAYIDAHGSIPEGLEIDHLCCNKACMNPDHLEAVTHRENCRRHHARKAAA